MHTGNLVRRPALVVGGGVASLGYSSDSDEVCRWMKMMTLQLRRLPNRPTRYPNGYESDGSGKRNLMAKVSLPPGMALQISAGASSSGLPCGGVSESGRDHQGKTRF
ncbi:hypothetical protein OUZ56_021336 [Daphnia magna]|uniref:Uncharacterized protein n=1 Tax=Daphnia magna TaxID=35525 RepID=A0ABQ9ZI47_9CRUS|nr:hypothetical protein OUZ56_021336 [Daphnia magna]